jgi:hypothetical protein
MPPTSPRSLSINSTVLPETTKVPQITTSVPQITAQVPSATHDSVAQSTTITPTPPAATTSLPQLTKMQPKQLESNLVSTFSTLLSTSSNLQIKSNTKVQLLPSPSIDDETVPQLQSTRTATATATATPQLSYPTTTMQPIQPESSEPDSKSITTPITTPITASNEPMPLLQLPQLSYSTTTIQPQPEQPESEPPITQLKTTTPTPTPLPSNKLHSHTTIPAILPTNTIKTKLRKRAKPSKPLLPIPIKSKPKKMEYFCRDLKGKKHDIKELRKLRNKSVLKGMKWMKKFLRRNKYKALYEIGDDAPSIFFEIWYTSADSRIRAEGGAIARELLNKLEKKMIKKDGGNAPDRDGFMALMFLARIRHEMGDMMECDALLKRADRSFLENGFHNTNHLFDVQLSNLSNIGTDPWLGLLMNILIMEFNNLLFPKRYPIEWGMVEALECIKDLPLDGPGGDDFHCSLFLATHIIYALGAYQSIKTKEKDCPWLYRYLRISMRHWMRQAWKLEKQKKQQKKRKKEMEVLLLQTEFGTECGTEASEANSSNGDSASSGETNETNATAKTNEQILDDIENTKLSNEKVSTTKSKDAFIYVELDGVSEIVDTLRGCGLTSASDRLVCEGSLCLLRTQKSDGSWPYWTDHGDGALDPDCSFYDVLHPTWVAVQGLRDRDFKLDRPASEKWGNWITKVVKQVGFAEEPTYENNWNKIPKSKKKDVNRFKGGVKKVIVKNRRRKKKKIV